MHQSQSRQIVKAHSYDGGKITSEGLLHARSVVTFIALRQLDFDRISMLN